MLTVASSVGGDGRVNPARMSLLLAFGTAFVVFGQGAAMPVLPEFTLGLGASTVGVAWAVALFPVGRLLVNVPIGTYYSKLPPRGVLLVGALTTAIGVIGCGFAPGFWSLLGFRAVGGIGSGIYMTAAILTVLEVAPAGDRGRYIGTNQTGLVSSLTIAPAVGGFFGEWFGNRASFILVGIVSLVGALYVLLKIPPYRTLADHATDEAGEHSDGIDADAGATPKILNNPETPETAGAPGSDGLAPSGRDSGGSDRAGGSGEKKSAAETLLQPEFLMACAVGFMIFGTRIGSRATLLPLIGTVEFGMSVGDLGVLFSAMSVLSLIVLQASTRITDRVGKVRMIVPAMAVAAGGLVALAYATSVPMLWIGGLIVTVGLSAAGPAPAAWAADVTPPERHGVAMSWFRTLNDVGSLVGPVALAALAAAVTFGVAFVANAGIMVVLAITTWRFRVGKPPIGVKAPAA